MINCENEICNKWFHADDCLGLSETEILNIEKFFCTECLNKNPELSIEYISPPAKRDDYCVCSEGESGQMIECGKCHNWYHFECVNLLQGGANQILIYFCQSCLNDHPKLKLIYKDYSRDHTKPLFKKHEILTVHNLFVYHILLELYKILKFRTPYCMYDLINPYTSSRGGIYFRVPEVNISPQQRSFSYQSIHLWNKLYKKLITPFTITLHKDHKLKSDVSSNDIICYDYTNTVSSFKSKLKTHLSLVQHSGANDAWFDGNWIQAL